MAATDVAPATEKGVTQPTHGPRALYGTLASSKKSAKVFDVPSAKQVLREAAKSSAGRAAITAVTIPTNIQNALTVLTGSTDAVSAQDITLFTGLSGYTADGSPTWGELVTALSS
jgi:hypothetical protein